MNIDNIWDKTVFLSKNHRFIIWSKEREFTCIDLTNGKRINMDSQVYDLLSLTIGKTVGEAFSNFTEASKDTFIGIVSRLFENNLITEEHNDIGIETYNSRPIEVLVVEITGKCNANCMFCYGKDSRECVSFPIDKLEEILDSYRSIGGQSVAISGGEPSVSSNLIPFIQMIEEKGLLLTGMGTNGSNFDEKLLDCLSRTNVVDGISVSLDSMYADEHTKIRGIANLGNTVFNLIAELNRRNIPVIINTIINRKNGPVEEFGNMLSDMGVKKWRLIQPFGIDRAAHPEFYYSFDEELDVLAQAYHAHQSLKWNFGLMSDTFINCIHTSLKLPNRINDNKLCGHRSRSLYVKANGDILRCNISREKPIANVYNRTIKDIWEDEITHLRKRPNMVSFDSCGTCKAKLHGLCSVNTFCPEISIKNNSCTQRLEHIYNKYITLIQNNIMSNQKNTLL